VVLWCPTVVTGSRERILKSLRAIAAARHQSREVERAVVGIHLEGPYISPEDGPRGAHPREHVRPPDMDEFDRFWEASEGRIVLVTVAPELPGMIPFIEKAVERGIVVAIGHTGPAREQIARVIADAVRAGATLSTHLGNGSHAKIDRLHNYIWEQLACDALRATIILDGHHLPPPVAKCVVRCKGPERCILVSDAIAAADMPPGDYGLEGAQVTIRPDGFVSLTGTPYMAGSVLNLRRAVENACRFTDASLAQAIDMASQHPAQALHCPQRIGLEVGKEANLIVFRWDAESRSMALEETIIGGRPARR